LTNAIDPRGSIALLPTNLLFPHANQPKLTKTPLLTNATESADSVALLPLSKLTDPRGSVAAFDHSYRFTTLLAN
jgi:hypothetical protein